jgi:hypothetical protein
VLALRKSVKVTAPSGRASSIDEPQKIPMYLHRSTIEKCCLALNIRDFPRLAQLFF